MRNRSAIRPSTGLHASRALGSAGVYELLARASAKHSASSNWEAAVTVFVVVNCPSLLNSLLEVMLCLFAFALEPTTPVLECTLGCNSPLLLATGAASLVNHGCEREVAAIGRPSASTTIGNATSLLALLPLWLPDSVAFDHVFERAQSEATAGEVELPRAHSEVRDRRSSRNDLRLLVDSDPVPCFTRVAIMVTADRMSNPTTHMRVTDRHKPLRFRRAGTICDTSSRLAFTVTTDTIPSNPGECAYSNYFEECIIFFKRSLQFEALASL